MTLFTVLNKLISLNLRHSGLTENSSHYFFEKPLNNCSLVIDLGANLGNFYSSMQKKYSCQCIAIEPSEDLFTKLPQSGNVKRFQIAIGQLDRDSVFYYSNNKEANSLYQTVSNHWGTVNSIFVKEKKLETFLVEEQITALIDILKVDVEGAEIDIFESLSSLTLSKIAQIPVEFHDFLITNNDYENRLKRVLNRLRQNNFLILKISTEDWRTTLCINKTHIHISAGKRFRLELLHPLLQRFKLLHIATSRSIRRARKN